MIWMITILLLFVCLLLLVFFGNIIPEEWGG